MFTAFLFLLGLIIGSFLNVAIFRGEHHKSLGGRSQCRSCGHTLSAKELIPVISFLVQKGRCLHCRTALSPQYPVVELGTGILFALAGYVFSPASVTGYLDIFLLFLLLSGIGASIVIFVSDVRSYIIPHGPVLILLSIGIILQAFFYFQILPHSLPIGFTPSRSLGTAFLASFLIALFFALLWGVSRGRWMGLGDAKLIFATSLIVGFPISLVACVFSFWLGGIVGIIVMLAKGKNLKYIIPFGPFILIGTGMAYALARWYPPLTRLMFFF